MQKYKISEVDIDFCVFRRSRGSGGQHANKTATAIRATHIPTGVKVEVCSERSQHRNKLLAVEMLQSKVTQLIEEKNLEIKKEKREAQPNSSFGSHRRTYRLCGNDQGVVDHKTNITNSNIRAVLRGDLDEFIKGNL